MSGSGQKNLRGRQEGRRAGIEAGLFCFAKRMPSLLLHLHALPKGLNADQIQFKFNGSMPSSR